MLDAVQGAGSCHLYNSVIIILIQSKKNKC